eukprot:12890541-Prorocentrum_lima.AAC.1
MLGVNRANFQHLVVRGDHAGHVRVEAAGILKSISRVLTELVLFPWARDPLVIAYLFERDWLSLNPKLLAHL